MRTNEERIAAMHKRAEQLEKENKSRSSMIAMGIASALCIAAIVLFALLMQDVSGKLAQSASTSTGNASIFAGSQALGYIVIAIIAFLLGIALTIFCIRLRAWQKLKEEHTSGTVIKEDK